jgi:hypothetical protein
MLSLLFCVDGNIVVQKDYVGGYDLLYVVKYNELLLYCAINDDQIPDSKEKFEEIRALICKEYYDFMLDCFNEKAFSLMLRMESSTSKDIISQHFSRLPKISRDFLDEHFGVLQTKSDMTEEIMPLYEELNQQLKASMEKLDELCKAKSKLEVMK